MTDPPLWSARIALDGNTSIVALSGELDLVAAGGLRQTLIAEIDRPGARNVIADLSDVTFLDSAALGALINAQQHAEGAGHHFTLANPGRSVRRVLDMTGVHDILIPPRPADD